MANISSKFKRKEWMKKSPELFESPLILIEKRLVVCINVQCSMFSDIIHIICCWFIKNWKYIKFRNIERGLHFPLHILLRKRSRSLLSINWLCSLYQFSGKAFLMGSAFPKSHNEFHKFGRWMEKCFKVHKFNSIDCQSWTYSRA